MGVIVQCLLVSLWSTWERSISCRSPAVIQDQQWRMENDPVLKHMPQLPQILQGDRMATHWDKNYVVPPSFHSFLFFETAQWPLQLSAFLPCVATPGLSFLFGLISHLALEMHDMTMHANSIMASRCFHTTNIIYTKSFKILFFKKSLPSGLRFGSFIKETWMAAMAGQQDPPPWQEATGLLKTNKWNTGENSPR